ncbi:hypothetical protein [Sorangium atrum]|uniref:Uncharacterized protein n=1 Tax=Sorangium atrum TaxID=2995308 RepID=A0ABT5C6Q0_9BACT|nr:hypothetical protein [Sorangium aterium]MDC0680842.1 hypothetical protein [Sorangium aterium]
MIHASTPSTMPAPGPTLAGADLALGSPPRAERLPTDLRALARSLGGPFAGLSSRARWRLASLCDGLAVLIQAQDHHRGAGDSVRSWPGFLLSSLLALRFDGEASPLSAQEEAWVVAEVEADFEEAFAAFRVRRAPGCSPARLPRA